jgi:alpha-mannosidase
MLMLALALLQHPSSPARPPVPIRSWLLTEPVPDDADGAGLDGGEAGTLPDSGDTWRVVLAADDGLVNVGRVVGGGRWAEPGVVYAFSYVRSARDATRRLVVASPDDVQVWLNGQRVYGSDAARGRPARRDTIEVRLAAGWNALLLKILTRDGALGYGAWLDGDEPVAARHRRPPDAVRRNLPAAALTVSGLVLQGPLLWRGADLEARAAARVTAWGRAPPRAARLELVAGRDTLARAPFVPGVPGAPTRVETVLDFATLARAALRDGELLVDAPGSATRRSVGLIPAAALSLLDGRIEIAGWRARGSTLTARVTVPTALNGLSLDLLVGEFGPAARYAVNGTEREWRRGIVALCDACSAGDTLAIAVRRDTTRRWWDPPRARVRDATYSDLALNARLLVALDSTLDIPLPDPDAWLAAMLEPDKTRYRQLTERYGARLAAHGRRLRGDTIHLVGQSRADAGRRPDGGQPAPDETWRGALEIQQRFPGATFAAASAAFYRRLERQAPGLLDSIRAAVRRGTWSHVGGWWYAGEQDLPSGEVLVRQGLFGQRAFERLFGERCSVAWAPDDAGYPWTLPQIWRGLGLRTVVTQTRGNDSTAFPRGAFVWEGRDGTPLFAYNARVYDDGAGPRLALEAARRGRRSGGRHALVLYEVGGSGRATTALLERLEDVRRAPAFPILADAAPERALDAIRRSEPAEAGPVWRDGLYHIAVSPRAGVNGPGEELLATAEMLAALDSAPYPRRALESAWQRFLSSDTAWSAVAAVRDAALARLARGLHTRGPGVPIVVFNPTSWVRSSYVAAAARRQVEDLRRAGELRAVDAAGRATPARLDGDSLRFFAREVPPLGLKVFWVDRGWAQRGRLDGTAARLENDWLLVEVAAATGRITRVVHKGSGREVLPSGGDGRGNVLELLSERGEAQEPDSVRAARWGGDELARWIEVEQAWNAARVVQRIVLRRDEPWVVIENDVDRRETGAVLTAVFDLNVSADSAWYEIPYGAVGRAVPRRTREDRITYEQPARWSDLSEAAFGVSVLTDRPSGWSVRRSRSSLSLLEALTPPDSLARGRHRFRYALYPHAGDWRDGETVRRAVEFTWPMPAVVERPHAGALGRSWSFASVDAPNVYVTALKRSEDGRSWVLRLVEWHGRATRATLVFGRRIARVRTANLLEDPLANLPVGRDEQSAVVALRPWEIGTLLVDEAR